MTEVRASRLPRLLIVQLALFGVTFTGFVLLILSVFPFMPRGTRPWLLALILVGMLGLDLLRAIEMHLASRRPRMSSLAYSLATPLIFTVLGVIWFGSPLAFVALALGLGSGAAVIALWTAARSKAPLTNG